VHAVDDQVQPPEFDLDQYQKLVQVLREPDNILLNPPVRPIISLENLIRELDVSMNEMYREGRLRPDPFSCTSIRSTNERASYSQLVEQDDYRTCSHVNAKVTFALGTDDETLIWCCGQFKLLSHVYVNAI